MKTNIATPRTLTRAIKNGMRMAAIANTSMPEEIEQHVLDFWKQTLAVVSLEGHDQAVRRIMEIIAKKESDREAA